MTKTRAVVPPATNEPARRCQVPSSVIAPPLRSAMNDPIGDSIVPRTISVLVPLTQNETE